MEPSPPPNTPLGTVAMRPSQVGGGASAGFPTATSCPMAAELSQSPQVKRERRDDEGQVVQGYSGVQRLNLDLRLILDGILHVKYGSFFPFCQSI